MQPGAQLPSAASQIARVMSQVLAQPGATSAAPLAAGKGKPLEIRLPQDPCTELRALARSLGREPDALAAELLAAAVSDAKTYLNASSVEALAIARRELLVADLPERQPGVEFHGGGT